MALRIGRVAVAGVGAVAGDLRAVLRLGWLPILVAGVAEAIVLGLVEDHFRDPYSNDFLIDYGWQTAGLAIVGLTAYGALANRWIARLLPHDGRQFGSGWRSFPQARDAYAALFLMIWLAICAGVLTGTIYLVIEALLDTASWVVPTVVFVVPSLVSLLVIGRVMLVMPMIALGQGVRPATTWRLTRGMSWRLLIGFALATVMILALWTALGFFTSMIGLFAETYLPYGFQLADLVPLAMHLAFGGVAFLILTGSIAEAYRELDGPGLGLSEDLLAVFDD